MEGGREAEERRSGAEERSKVDEARSAAGCEKREEERKSEGRSFS